MTEYKIPTEVEEMVLTRVFARAAKEDWTNLRDSDRTSLYQQWTDDPEVGGRLIGFVGTTANVRTWLKDGPMKEYQRARRGEGRYARYVTTHAATLEEIITKVLGKDWEVVPKSKRAKPMRVRVRRTHSEDDEIHFVTGPKKNFKHLTWPAILDRSNGESAPWMICVIDPFLNPVTREEKAQHEAVARFLGVQVTYFNEV